MIYVDCHNITQISGVGEGKINAEGQTSIELILDKYAISHNFHLVTSDFPILCDGIIAIDFIKS